MPLYHELLKTLLTVVITSAVFVLPVTFYGGRLVGKVMARLTAIEQQLCRLTGNGEEGVPQRCVRHDERLKVVESSSDNLEVRAKKHSDIFDELTGRVAAFERGAES